jgi:NADP-dependent 3-hydroxy acid dehydrogenase YdfG
MSGTTLFIITGATRGFGKSISLSLARNFRLFSLLLLKEIPPKSLNFCFRGSKYFILTGRNAQALNETTSEISQYSTSAEPIRCQQSILDFSDLNTLPGAVNQILTQPESFDKVVLINNAGSLVSTVLLSVF